MSDATSFEPDLPAHYRQVLGRVPTSVAIIASTNGGGPVGVAVGSFTSVSLDPPLVGFLIATTSTTWPAIEATGGFCASVLHADHEQICRLFATRGADKFAACEWTSAPSGRPIIAD